MLSHGRALGASQSTLAGKGGQNMRNHLCFLPPPTAFSSSIPLRVASALIILFLSPPQSSLPFPKSPCQALL